MLNLEPSQHRSGDQLAPAGVPVRRVKILCFFLCSFLSGLVGIVERDQVRQLEPG